MFEKFYHTMNEKNLTVLAEHFDTLNEDEFDMAAENEFEERWYMPKKTLSPLGHAVKLKGLEPIGSDFKDNTLNFNTYSDRVFGKDVKGLLWNWLFNKAWKDTDNTPKGAALRIRYLLDNAEAPNTTNEQLFRDGYYEFTFENTRDKSNYCIWSEDGDDWRVECDNNTLYEATGDSYDQDTSLQGISESYPTCFRCKKRTLFKRYHGESYLRGGAVGSSSGS